MAANVHLNKSTVEAFKAKLSAAREGLKQEGVAMKQVAVMLDSWVQRNFKDKGSNVGGWAPYKYGGRLAVKNPSKSKAKKTPNKANAQSIDGRRWINGSAVLLRDTGALQHSFLPFIRKGTAGIGSELLYSKPHEDGDSSRNLPQRRMLPKNADVDVQVLKILDNFVRVSIRKAQ